MNNQDSAFQSVLRMSFLVSTAAVLVVLLTSQGGCTKKPSEKAVAMRDYCAGLNFVREKMEAWSDVTIEVVSQGKDVQVEVKGQVADSETYVLLVIFVAAEYQFVTKDTVPKFAYPEDFCFKVTWPGCSSEDEEWAAETQVQLNSGDTHNRPEVKGDSVP